MKLFISAFLLLSSSSFGQIFYPAGNANKVNGATVPASQPCIGSNSSSQLIAGTCSGSSTLTSTHFFVGNVSNAAVDVAMSKDATLANTGAVTVIGLNGTILSGLATGILKNTTATGVPSIATAGTDYFNAASQITLGGDLSGVANSATVLPLSLLKGGWTNWVDPKQCDSVHAYCAAGSITTTTGSISSGTNQLTVASATGWTVGMGIGVAGAGAAAAELFTSVTVIAGTTFTLAANASTTATTQIVNHDDTAAIVAAIGSGFNVHLSKGKYNVHAATNADILTISNPLMFTGDGNWDSGTVILPRSINTQVFAIRPEITSLASTPVGTFISDLMVQQPSGFTQTGGTAFKVAAASGLSGHYVANVHIDRTTTNNMCTAMVVGIGAISNWYTDSYIINGAVTNTSASCSAVGGGIYFDSIQPSGDWHFQDLELSGLNTGVYIVKSDTNQWVNVKINGGKLSIVPTSNGDVQRVRFVNFSIEGLSGGPTTGVTIGPNASTQLSFIGGGIGLSAFTSGIAATATAGLRVEGMHFYNLAGTPVALTGSSAAIVGNYFAGSATQVSLASSSSASIAGNVTEAGTGTFFLTTDASANKVSLAGNRTDLGNTIGAGSLMNYAGYLRGTTGSIGGALTVGACDTGTATVTGATTGMVASTSPVTYPGDGFDYIAYVSAADTVTVKLCAKIVGTPTSSAYNVSVTSN